MTPTNSCEPVRCWEDQVVIPTHLGWPDMAIDGLSHVAVSNPSHQAGGFILVWIEQERKLIAVEPEVRPTS